MPGQTVLYRFSGEERKSSKTLALISMVTFFSGVFVSYSQKNFILFAWGFM
jgi:hypothetical protein